MEICGKLCAPAALPPPKYPPVPIEEEAVWALEGVWTLYRIETAQTPDANGAPFPQLCSRITVSNSLS
jgi:hypothetical protein